ncbi:MAG: hypothetical protein P1U41_01015 [Vicingaceae bacterium]|nr:hypothetical protein [Vicingaceae bacterium]
MRLNVIGILAAIICFIFCLIIQGYYLSTSIGLAFSLFIIIDFITKLGKVFPLKEFILLIASLQWIVGAKISYSFGKTHHKYYMYVDEDVYMNYVVPGVIALCVGLFLINTSMPIKKIKDLFNEENKKRNIKIAYTLIFIGLISSLSTKFFRIPSLAFIIFLATLLLYVGVSYLFFLFPKRKWLFFMSTLGVTLILSIESGMFHNLLLVASFFGFLVIPSRTNFFTKLTLISIGVFFMYMLQVIKKDFREEIFSGKNVNSIEVFYTLIEREFIVKNDDIESHNNLEEEQKNADANNRLNQGWIISRVLENVPSKKPFLGGSTIWEAIEASLLPRFLAPNKKGTEQGLINFKEITGLLLSKNASMGLSLIAEFYANYGIVGGWVAMFIYGLFIALIIKYIINKLGKGSYLIVLWLIVFFFQVVKAETDFIKIFNHIIKSILFFMIVNWGLAFIGIKLFTRPINKIEEKK